MSDFNTVDPNGWEYDLQSIYAAYMGHFQLHNIAWFDKSWGPLFESFDEFLGFSWPAIVITDSWTAKAHIVTKMSCIHSFLKMIKTRFGETLPLIDNFLKVSAFEITPRPVRTISDQASYRKAHQTLAGAVLSAFKTRVRTGEPNAVMELWNSKNKTFLAIDFEWSERNTSSTLEFGYSAVRCSHLDAMSVWPPDPETNYRRGHYIVSEYVGKVQNKHSPVVPWDYAFGESQVIPKARLPMIIQAIISSLSSPDSDSTSNDLVLVAHGIGGDLQRLAEMKIKLPHNMLVIDTAIFEKQLFSMGHRGPMVDVQSGKARAPKTMISLAAVFRSLTIDIQCTFHNSGNDAFLSLLALQLLLDKDNTKLPNMRGRAVNRNNIANRSGSRSPAFGIPPPLSMPIGPFPIIAPQTPSPSTLTPTYSMNAYLDNEFGAAQRRQPGHSNGTASKRGKGDRTGNGSNRQSQELTASMRNLRV